MFIVTSCITYSQKIATCNLKAGPFSNQFSRTVADASSLHERYVNNARVAQFRTKCNQKESHVPGETTAMSSNTTNRLQEKSSKGHQQSVNSDLVTFYVSWRLSKGMFRCHLVQFEMRRHILPSSNRVNYVSHDLHYFYLINSDLKRLRKLLLPCRITIILI